MILFLKNITGKVFKILPLKEENNIGFYDYVDSILVQLIGAKNTFSELENNQDFLTVINIIQYIKNNKCSNKQCKREIFKCLNIIQKITEEQEG